MQRMNIMIGLAILVVILGLVVIFEPGKTTPAEKPSITSIKPEAQTTFTVKRKGGGSIRLEKRDSHWWLVEPYAAPADDGRVNEALNVLTAQSEKRFAADEIELAEFGLNEPELTLQLGDTTLEFGTSHPINHQRHVRLGDAVHRIQDFYFYQLSADAAQWVSLKLIPHGKTLNGLTLPDREIQLESDGTWGPEAGTGQLGASELAAAWVSAEAYRVEVPETPPAADRPRITLRFNDNTTLELSILAEEPELQLASASPALVWTLYASQTANLLGRTPAEAATTDAEAVAPTSEPGSTSEPEASTEPESNSALESAP